MRAARYDEQAILRRIANGDANALRLLHEKYWRLVYHIVRKHTGLGDFAEDVAQEVFTVLWEKREELTSITNFSAYLGVMTRRMALHQVRRLSQEIEVTKEFMYRHGRDTLADTSTEDLMLERQYQSLVDDALNTLTPSQRRVFILSRYENKSYDEIAAELDLTPNTVKKHVADALITIRKRIKSHLAYLILAISLMPDHLDTPNTTPQPCAQTHANRFPTNACFNAILRIHEKT